MAVRVAIVGLGKIAHDQHIPAIAASDEFELAAAASLSGTIDGIPVFESVDALLGAGIAIDAIAMCQPPQARFEAAAKAIRAGKHLLLEKPPGAPLPEVDALTPPAAASPHNPFAAWPRPHTP